jgi:LysR family transcriptional regulator, glycine cleavage system transcriptional activator
VELFRRGPRGLAFTEEGEILYDYSKRAFDTLGAGLRHLSMAADRESLVVSAARSFAVRVLGARIARFVEANPWVDLRVDTHRYFADLETSGADISIRLGSGDWDGYRMQAVTDDAVWAVARADVAGRLTRKTDAVVEERPMVLTNTERDYWVAWQSAGLDTWGGGDERILRFNDSATMLEAVEAGAGFCITRASLVHDAVGAGTLVRVGSGEVRDGLRYYAVFAPRSGAKKAADVFMKWLEAEFGSVAGESPPRKT